MSNNRGRAAPVLLILLAGIVVGAVNVLLYVDTTASLSAGPVPRSFLEAVHQAYSLRPLHVLYLAGVPVAATLMVALVTALAMRREPRAAVAPAAAPPADEHSAQKAHEEGALRLLGLLQKEGRFIDFVQEDLTPYDDAQVGAAVRPIQAGCRQALQERIVIERIYDRDEGSQVEVGPEFDPACVRLTGNVQGDPPFRGTLQHAGWRATRVELPTVAADVDATVLAPAEVEIE